MTGKELKALLDGMTEEELEMTVVFDADFICTGAEGNDLYTPSDVYVDDEDDDDEYIVIDAEPVTE